MRNNTRRRVLKNTISPALVHRALRVVHRALREMERRLVRVETRLVRLAHGMKVKVK